MKLYLDTAEINEIEEIAKWGVLSGITTNPTLIAQSGKDFKETILKICDLVKGPISAEVTGNTAEEMIAQGQEIARWNDQIVIKIPTTIEGLKACAELTGMGIDTNLTLCFSVNQALLCARAGATYVSPFIGRMEDINQDGISLIHEIKTVFDLHDIKTEIIAASIRTPKHVTDAALAGADIATLPFKILKQMIEHPLTKSGLEKFNADWKNFIGKTK